MNEALSPGAVDSLLEHFAREASEAAAAPEPEAGAGKPRSREPASVETHYRPYDFRHPNRVSKELERSLKTLHDGFARALSTNLSAYLRMLVEARLVSLRQLTYGEFIAMLENPTVMSAVAIPPLEGSVVMEISPRLVFQMIDRLLGGEGNPMETLRELTQIEQNVALKILERALGPWAEMWDSVIKVEPALQGLELAPQMVQVVAPSEITIVAGIELRMRESTEMMNVCLPFLVVEPLLARIGSTPSYAGMARRSSQAPEQVARQVERARVTLTAYLGKTETTLADLAALRPGDLLTLDRGPGDLIEIWVNNRPSFLGRAGTRKGIRAVAVESAAPNPSGG